jgi:hypothetical protein
LDKPENASQGLAIYSLFVSDEEKKVLYG